MRFQPEYGHEAVATEVTEIKAKRGRDLSNISERIFEDDAFNAELAEIIEETKEGTQGTWGDKWEAIKVALRDRCLEKTSGVRSRPRVPPVATTLPGHRGAAGSIRQHYVQRRFTNLEGHVAEKTRKKFEAVVHIELDGKYTLTNALKRAVAAARHESERRREATAQTHAG